MAKKKPAGPKVPTGCEMGKHPSNRRIGNACMECGNMTAWGKKG